MTEEDSNCEHPHTSTPIWVCANMDICGTWEKLISTHTSTHAFLFFFLQFFYFVYNVIALIQQSMYKTKLLNIYIVLFPNSVIM